MAIELMQREVDAILDGIIRGETYRNILAKEPHIAEFNAKIFAKQLLMADQKTPDYKDYRAGTGKYEGQGPRKTGGSYKGEKRESRFEGFDDSTKKAQIKRQLAAYSKKILSIYKGSPEIKGLSVGGVKQIRNYTYQLLEISGDHVKFLIRVAPGKSANPYDAFFKMNQKIQTNYLMGSGQEQKKLRILFGIQEASSFADEKAYKKSVQSIITSYQQIGHAEDSAVVQKKARATYASLEEATAGSVDLDYLPDSALSSVKKASASVRDTFGIEVGLEHSQKYVPKDGRLRDELLVSVSVESEAANQMKSGRKSKESLKDAAKTEDDLGKQLKTLLEELQADLKKEYDNAKTPEAKRSPSAVQLVGYSLFSGKTLKKVLRNKKVSKKSRSVYTKKVPKVGGPKRVTASAKKEGPVATYSMGLLDSSVRSKLPKSKASKKAKEVNSVETGTSTQDALVARAFINSRLPQQVARNMGRPGLENITGRFAESVNIVNASSTGNMSHFDYTYNPLYRVFEGGRDFTPNYDPRPLIERSIRDLAAARLETKFTLRRV